MPFPYNTNSARTERYIRAGLTPRFLSDMEIAVDAMKNAGYDPYDQLTGYLRTGNIRYITRNSGARELVENVDGEHIKIFLKHVYK